MHKIRAEAVAHAAAAAELVPFPGVAGAAQPAYETVLTVYAGVVFYVISANAFYCQMCADFFGNS
jgi:hypothetical protein